MHVNTLPSSMLPTQYTWRFHWGHLRPIYFWYQVYFLLFLFYLSRTYATASRDVKRVFKSISKMSIRGFENRWMSPKMIKGSTATLKPHYDKKASHKFLCEIQTRIDNDSNKSIVFITKDVGESEFLRAGNTLRHSVFVIQDEKGLIFITSRTCFAFSQMRETSGKIRW